MHYQLWDLFYREEIYSSWKEKVKHYQSVNLLKWQNICEFLSVAEHLRLFKGTPPKHYTLVELLKVAEDYNYFFTEEEFVWVLITNKQIWDFFAIAQKTLSLREELLLAKNPQQFVKIARENGYYFTIEALGWLLIEVKSYSAGINNSVGEILTAPVVGRTSTIEWISLAENWGLVPPFCHRDKPTGSMFLDGDIADPEYFMGKCFLPRCYFNQRANEPVMEFRV